MAFTTAVILGSALAGAGIAEIVSSLSSQPEQPDLPGASDLPNSDKAKKDATENQANQRRMLLTTGGQTDVTGGTGVLTGSDVSKTTLLGG